MRVLLSFENFVAFGGTESYTLTVAMELDRLGHDVTIYSPNHGPMADYAFAQGVNVTGRQELPDAWDVLISSDTATCHELAGRCQDAVRIFVAHSVDSVLQVPPHLGHRCQAVVVLNDRVRRAVEARAWHAPIVRLRQPIDFLRFNGIGPGRSTARTAVAISNHLRGLQAEMIKRACRANGLDFRRIGGPANQTPSPELAIAGAKLVIGLGRSVLEAMAAGRAVYVFGVIGGDGWVTADSYPAMEADGFAGTAASGVLVDEARLTEDLGRWQENMGEINSDLVAAHHTAREHAIQLVKLARELDVPPPVEPSHGEEFARLIRLQWQNEARAVESLGQVDRLTSALAEARATAVHYEALARTANEQLEALRDTRRYRLACRVASPLDRLRDRLHGHG